MGDKGLSPFAASTAAATTELAVSGPVRYLAVWRLLPSDAADDAAAGDGSAWEHIRRIAACGPAYLYVPAFSMLRPVVQQIGVRLTEVQPALELTPGGPVGPGRRPALVEAGPRVSSLPGAALSAPGAGPVGGSAAAPADVSIAGAPDFDAVSPVLIGSREAWGLAHFVYMAIEAREARDLHAADPGLEPGQDDLLFIPAVWDPRHIHESNWRLLLREFDGLVA